MSGTYRRVAGVTVGALFGAAIWWALALVAGPQYTSTATVLVTGLPGPGRGALVTVSQHVQARLPTWAQAASSGAVADEAVRLMASSGGRVIGSITASPVSGTELIEVSMTAAEPTRLGAGATAAATALASVITTEETPPQFGSSRIRAVVITPGTEVVDVAAGRQRLLATLGAVAGALFAVLESTLRRPGSWARGLANRGPPSREAELDGFAEAVGAELQRWLRGARSRTGYVAIGGAALAVGGYAITGSSLPPLLVVVAASIAGVRDPRWPAAALLLVSVSVLPTKLNVVAIGPITPTVLEVSVALGLVAMMLHWCHPGSRSAFTAPVLGVLGAGVVGALVGFARGGEVSATADALRAILVLVGFFVLYHAFVSRPVQLLVLLLVGAAASSAVVLLAAAAGWQRLLVDERASVLTGTDTAEVARLASPVLDLWTPLLVILVSGAVPMRPRWLWWSLLLPGVLHQVLSFNRSTWAPLLACVLVVGALRGGLRAVLSRAAVLAAGLVLTVMLASSGILTDTATAIADRATSVTTGEALAEDSLPDRLRENAAAIQVLRDDPLLGTGMVLPYGAEVISYDALHSRTVVESRLWIHNQYLRIWLMMGVLGLLAYGLLAVRVVALSALAWSWRAPASTLIVAASVGLGGLAAQALFQTTLLQRSAVLAVAAVLAVLAAAAPWPAGSAERGSPPETAFSKPSGAGIMGV